MVLTTAVPAIAVYLAGIPIGVLVLLTCNRRHLQTAFFQRKYGFLYANYHIRAYYWEVVVMARLLAFCIISVLYENNVPLQAGLGLVRPTNVFVAVIREHAVIHLYLQGGGK